MSYINERTFLTGHLLLDPEATRNLFRNYILYFNTILSRDWEVRVPNNLSITWNYSN